MSSIWYLTNNESDLGGGVHFNNTLVDTPTSGLELQITLTGENEEVSYGFTNEGMPDNDHWESGGITVNLDVSAVARETDIDMSISRIDSSGTVLETTENSGVQRVETTGTHTFNIPSMTWSAGSESDRLRLNFYSAGTHHKQDSGITIDSLEIDTPIEISPTIEYEGSVSISEKTNISVSGESHIPFVADISISEKVDIKTSITVKYATEEVEGGSRTATWTFDDDAEGWSLTDMEFVDYEGNPPGSLSFYSESSTESASSPDTDLDSLDVPEEVENINKIVFDYDLMIDYLPDGYAEFNPSISVDDDETSSTLYFDAGTPIEEWVNYSYERIIDGPIGRDDKLSVAVSTSSDEYSGYFDNAEMTVYWDSVEGEDVHNVYKHIRISESSNVSIVSGKDDVEDHYTQNIFISESSNVNADGIKEASEDLFIENDATLYLDILRLSRGVILVSESSHLALESFKNVEGYISISEASTLPISANVSRESGILIGAISGGSLRAEKSSADNIEIKNIAEIYSIGDKQGVGSLSISNTYNISVIGDTEEPSYDFVGSVVISEKYEEKISGRKSIRAPTEISTATRGIIEGHKGSNKEVQASLKSSLVLYSNKDIGISFRIGSFTGVESEAFKSNYEGIGISAPSNVSVTGGDATDYSFVGSVKISERSSISATVIKVSDVTINIPVGYGLFVESIKRNTTQISISLGSQLNVSGVSEISADFSGEVSIQVASALNIWGSAFKRTDFSISDSTYVEFLGEKDASEDIHISNGANIKTDYRLPYTKLIPSISYMEREVDHFYREGTAEVRLQEKTVGLSIKERTVNLDKVESIVKTEVVLLALSGNTVRIKAEFKDFDGTNVSPDNVVLRIYSKGRVQINDDISLSPMSEGIYEYDYEIPNLPDRAIYYEFAGELGGNPVIARGKIDITWM